MRTALFVLALTMVPLHSPAAQSTTPAHSASANENAHVVSNFRFEVTAPMAKVAPLFAPEAERRWAGENWKPVFLYPQPGDDVQGAVWTIQHGTLQTVWVNTIFDVPGGRMQYVAMVSGQLVTVVDVQVTALTPSRTAVSVTYTRTALDSAANEHVRALGEKDRGSGPEWQQGIQTALGLGK